MNFTEDEIKEYVEKTKKFYGECYVIFLNTVHKDDPKTDFFSFDIYTDTSILYYKDFEGDLCEYTFPTEWLNKDSAYIVKEHEKRNEF